MLYNDKICVETSIKYQKYNINELDKNRILCQIQKMGNTMFRIKDITIEVEHLKLPVSQLNLLRREATQKFENALEKSIQRTYEEKMEFNFKVNSTDKTQKPKINLFLQRFHTTIQYSKLDYHEIYVPFANLINSQQIRDCIAVLPYIIDEDYEKLILENQIVLDRVKGVLIGHISQVELLKRLNFTKKIVADYALNITNQLSEKVIKELGIKRFTISPELDKNAIPFFSNDLEKELVVYGRTCLMTSKYCPIGKNEDCKMLCKQGKYALKDRKDFVFPVVTDCINCHAKIYNSKILSISDKNLGVDFVRVDVLDETEEEIKAIIATVKRQEKLNGSTYTNGNFNK